MKKVLALVVAVLAVLTLASCDNAEKYYNKYFGLTVTVKKDYIVDWLYPDNMSAKADETDDIDKFTLETDEDGYGIYWFISLSSCENSDLPEFAQVAVVGEPKSSYGSLEDFIQTYLSLYEEYGESYQTKISDDGVYTLNGKEFRKISALVEINGLETAFREDVYIAELPDVFLYIYVFTWEGSDKSASAARDMLSCVSLK